jgi:hypothetical protein
LRVFFSYKYLIRLSIHNNTVEFLTYLFLNVYGFNGRIANAIAIRLFNLIAISWLLCPIR